MISSGCHKFAVLPLMGGQGAISSPSLQGEGQGGGAKHSTCLRARGGVPRLPRFVQMRGPTGRTLHHFLTAVKILALTSVRPRGTVKFSGPESVAPLASADGMGLGLSLGGSWRLAAPTELSN